MRSLQIENESMAVLFDRLDDKAEYVRALMERVSVTELTDLWNQLDISAIYHDCALEGEVISPEELNSAFDPRIITDATSLPLYTALRNHKRAFETVRQIATQKEIVFSLDMFLKFHLIFTTKEVEPGRDLFRKDIPLHRTYFHEINPAPQIANNINELILWMNDPQDKKNMHPMLWAARFHHRFMRIFPFLDTSGKVGRAIMNIYLLSQGYLPSVVHATERQRYYETIRNSQQDLSLLLVDSEMASLDSAIRYLKRVAVAFV